MRPITRTCAVGSSRRIWPAARFRSKPSLWRVRRAHTREPFRGGVAIGDQIIDLAALAKAQVFDGDAAAGVRAGSAPTLNSLMQLGRASHPRCATLCSRRWPRLSARGGDLELFGAAKRSGLCTACAIGDYTISISPSITRRIGRSSGRTIRCCPIQVDPDRLPRRSSSIGVSGQSFRGRGVKKPLPAEVSSVGPAALDYELEMGIFIGAGNADGAPIAMADAEQPCPCGREQSKPGSGC